MGQQVNRGELATILGRSPNTIDTMVRKGCPFVERPERSAGKGWLFNTEEVVNWLIAEEGSGSEKSDPFKDANLIEKVAMAGLRTLEYAERQKVLVRKDDSLRWVAEGISIIKTRLLALPARVAQSVSAESDPVKNLAYLKAEVNDMLIAMSSHFGGRAQAVEAERDAARTAAQEPTVAPE
jgi:hypothetical protein